MKVLSIFGTRPEAIKMASLVSKLQEDDFFTSMVCVTAQHRQMLDQVLDVFDFDIDYDLDLMEEKQTLPGLSARVLESVSGVLEKASPDLVLVHGDTTTSFFSALAAFYQKIPVGHVEAGLRTGSIYSPWPEEVNRRLIAPLARFNFSPTELAATNLRSEGISADTICVTGNTVVDSLLEVEKNSLRITA